MSASIAVKAVSRLVVTLSLAGAAALGLVTDATAQALVVGANFVVKSLDPETDGINNPTADGTNHADDNIANSGYSVDDAAVAAYASGCFDGVGGVVPTPVTLAMLGGGTPSPLLGSPTTGLIFTLGE